MKSDIGFPIINITVYSVLGYSWNPAAEQQTKNITWPILLDNVMNVKRTSVVSIDSSFTAIYAICPHATKSDSFYFSSRLIEEGKSSIWFYDYDLDKSKRKLNNQTYQI